MKSALFPVGRASPRAVPAELGRVTPGAPSPAHRRPGSRSPAAPAPPVGRASPRAAPAAPSPVVRGPVVRGPSAFQPSALALLTRRDLAAVLKVSVRTIDRLTAAGVLPCHRIGRKAVRYILPEILCHLADEKVK